MRPFLVRPVTGLRIYLAGPIFGQSDDQANSWRRQVREIHPGTVLDPMDRDYRGRESENVNAIVELDKLDIRRSDAVIANCPYPSYGTAMEIYFAHSIHRPVLTVVPDGPVSPWLAYHSSVVLHVLHEAVEMVNTREFWEDPLLH